MTFYAIKTYGGYIEVDYNGCWTENPNIWRARFWHTEKYAQDYMANAGIKDGQVVEVTISEGNV